MMFYHIYSWIFVHKEGRRGRSACPLMPLLKIHPITAQRRLLKRSAVVVACFQQAFIIRGNILVWVDCYSYRFLISGHLKIANSFHSNSAIFLTVTGIRNHYLAYERINLGVSVLLDSFGFAKHCWLWLFVWFLMYVDSFTILIILTRPEASPLRSKRVIVNLNKFQRIYYSL